MKLTERQKKIFLVSALLFFLAVTMIISIVLVVSESQKKASPQTPSKNNLPNDKSGLTQIKIETITSFEQKLSSDNVKKDDFLKELKENHYLTAGEDN